jgi:allantoinase
MIQHHRAEELYDRTVAQFDRLYEESAHQGAKVMGLAVHPYISGVPHRIGWFERALVHMASHQGTLFWQGRQITDWYRTASA